MSGVGDALEVTLEPITVEEGVFCPVCVKWTAYRVVWGVIDSFTLNVEMRGVIVWCPDCDGEQVETQQPKE